jgi:hypothetical protein
MSTEEQRARWREAAARYAKTDKGKAAHARYRQTPKGLASRAEWQREDAKKNRDRTRARKRVYMAVKDGRLTRPDSCEHCGASGVPIEASHDEYTYERALDVEWLCRPCHRTKDGIT